jgi:hypothetical protein
MRSWARDVDDLYRVVEQDRALPPEQRQMTRWKALAPDQVCWA